MRKSLFIIALLLFAFPVAVKAQEKLLVFAAASMKEAMDRAATAFEAQTGTDVTLSLAASSVLARQIAAGAPADIYVSADTGWMDWLEERGAVRRASIRSIAGNDLVIAVRPQHGSTANPSLLLSRRFAMGDPDHVPAGRYARAGLESLGLWQTVQEHAIFGENVRVALELARRGEVEAAIVYGSDLAAAAGLVRAYRFPAGAHPPVIYKAAATANGNLAAEPFLAFLESPAGRKIFRKLGFSEPAE